MLPLMQNQIYNLERLVFHRVKVENIFTVESLIQSLEKFLLLNHLEFNECCTRFTDKFFAHFASNKLQMRFLPNVTTIKLKKVVINQINMTSEVFFDCFDKLQTLELDDCFKAAPYQRNRSPSPSQTTQWQAVY